MIKIILDIFKNWLTCKNDSHDSKMINKELRFRNREFLKYYIKGQGIEIGALHNPLDLTELNITKIQYVDRLTEPELRKQYPELNSSKLVPVDVVDDGEILSKFSDQSLDFIIANHFIEHARNPIRTIENWLTKLKIGGIIFATIPDKRFIFDANRPLTPIQHLIEDYYSSEEESKTKDRQHYIEWAKYTENLKGDQIEECANQLINMNYSIHFHTFTLKSFLEFLLWMQNELKLPFELTACVNVSKDEPEFVIVISRI